jgi:pantoate--beta-alanine ligase
MGFLHEGHLSLVRLAKTRADRVVLSLFVNPTQFGPQEDLNRYPSSVERDLALCEQEGVSVVFMPEAGSMYEGDASVKIEENMLSQGLCGESRPGHFSGVLTVVAKLFLLTQPDVAVFGEKDAQQLRLIRRMVRDLNFPVEIVPGPIVREADGVAMSSRNANLSAEERTQATVLRRSLLAVESAVAKGEREVAVLRSLVTQRLTEATLGRLDYLSFVDDETLAPVERLGQRPVLAALAVQFPGARLIDNIQLTLPI